MESCKNIFIEHLLCTRHFAKCFLCIVTPYKVPWERTRCHISHLSHTETWWPDQIIQPPIVELKLWGSAFTHPSVCFLTPVPMPSGGFRSEAPRQSWRGSLSPGEILSAVQPEDRQLPGRDRVHETRTALGNAMLSATLWAWERRRERTPWRARADGHFWAHVRLQKPWDRVWGSWKESEVGGPPKPYRGRWGRGILLTPRPPWPKKGNFHRCFSGEGSDQDTPLCTFCRLFNAVHAENKTSGISGWALLSFNRQLV